MGLEREIATTIYDFTLNGMKPERIAKRIMQLIKNDTANPQTAEVSPSNSSDLLGDTDFNKGTWYQSAVSGMWYEESEPAGEVAQIRLDGTYYIPFKAYREKGL